MIRLAQLIIIAAALTASALPSAAFEFMKSTPGDPETRVPTCDDPGVHRTISGRFADADREYYDGIEAIESFHDVTQVALVAHRPSPLVRRYCRARVAMSDDHTRTMYYMIEEKASFVSWTSGVEFCIRGLDRWRVYDGNCRTVRP